MNAVRSCPHPSSAAKAFSDGAEGRRQGLGQEKEIASPYDIPGLSLLLPCPPLRGEKPQPGQQILGQWAKVARDGISEQC